MKPQAVLSLVVVLLLAAGAVVFSGLFSDDPLPSATEKSTSGEPNEPSIQSAAPTIAENAPAAQSEPAQRASTREEIKTDANGIGSLRGLVVNKEGKGVPDADVTLYYGPSNPAFRNVAIKRPAGFTAKTDADGVYEMVNVPPAQNYALVAVHPQYAQGERMGVMLNDGEDLPVPEIVLGSGATLRGAVRAKASDSPIADATVELWDLLGSNFLDATQRKPWATTKTDAAGNYAFPNVHFTSYEVVASAPTYATISRRETQIFLAQPSEGDRVFDFVLPAATAISGVCVDSRGVAIPEVRVDAEQIGLQANEGTARSFATTGQDGRFTISALQEGTFQLAAAKRGFTQKFAGQFPSGSTDVRIQLDSKGVANGKVVTPDGRPVTRFELVLHIMRENTPAPTNQAMQFQAANGTFSFNDIEPGQYVLEANAENFAPSKSQPFYVDRDKATENVQIVMTLGGGIRGRVLSSSGEPVANAEVAIQDNDYTANFLVDLFAQLPNQRPTNVPKTRTAKDGSFEFQHLMPATVQIEVKAKSHSTLQKHDVVVTEGVIFDAGVLTMSTGGEIIGNVVDADGRPFVDGTITATPVANPNDPNSAKNSVAKYQNTKPDYDGRFSFRNLSPGDWELQVTPEKVDGKEMNPLLGVMMSSQTKQTIPVRDGVPTTITLKIPRNSGQ